MPIFKYKGYRTDGSDADGTIEASGLNDAMVRVREEGIFPSEVTESGGAKRAVLQRADQTFLPHVTRQLSLLLSSGVPLMEALQSLSAEHKGMQREMIVSIKERVSGGVSLYKALEDFPYVFPEFFTSMVHSGEQSGTLEKVLLRLADFLESQNAIRAKVRASLVYPILMMAVSAVVLSFLFTFVIPKIVKIFNDSKAALPFITVVLIFLSNLFIKYWWIMTGGMIGATVYVRRFVAAHRRLMDKLLLGLPGNILQSLYYSRFARTLGFLLEGGLPMLRALDLAAKSMGNRELEVSVRDAEKRVAEGQSLSATLEGFPPVFVQLIATGERSGRLSETLKRAADSYEDEFNRKVSRAVSLFEPAMILVMGLVVLFIVLAVLLPMFQLNQLIK